MQDYIGWAGEWQAGSPEQASGYNEVLAQVLAEGSSAGAAKPASLDPPVQDIPLRLALVGAPFCGKTAMALKLADEYGCKVLSMRLSITVAELDCEVRITAQYTSNLSSGPAMSVEM